LAIPGIIQRRSPLEVLEGALFRQGGRTNLHVSILSGPDREYFR
jgi:hypothetical protein